MIKQGDSWRNCSLMSVIGFSFDKNFMKWPYTDKEEKEWNKEFEDDLIYLDQFSRYKTVFFSLNSKSQSRTVKAMEGIPWIKKIATVLSSHGGGELLHLYITTRLEWTGNEHQD